LKLEGNYNSINDHRKQVKEKRKERERERKEEWMTESQRTSSCNTCYHIRKRTPWQFQWNKKKQHDQSSKECSCTAQMMQAFLMFWHVFHTCKALLSSSFSIVLHFLKPIELNPDIFLSIFSRFFYFIFQQWVDWELYL
jgi:hypothetical protein